jgi:CRP-like cAMP-binding protein
MIGAGAMVGGVEMLGELPHAQTLEATTRVRTLAFGAQAVYDVIEDHTELGLAVLSSFASALL